MMDYEAIDRDMSSWVVTVKRLTTRFFLTDNGLGSDIPAQARRWRYYEDAVDAANTARAEYAWRGFNWEPMSVPTMLAQNRGEKSIMTDAKRLGVKLPCSHETLKAAYRAAARRLHPDVGGAPELFAAMQAAYERLRDDAATYLDVDPRRVSTVEGFRLVELGLGLGPTVNGKDCPECQGRGYLVFHTMRSVQCSTCWGRGRVLFRRCLQCLSWGRSVQCSTCHTCHGREGRVSFRRCPQCLGWRVTHEQDPRPAYCQCDRCQGAGEVVLFNPALPKGRVK